MKRLRVGTRGSDLALAQTRGVCDRLRTLGADLEIELVVIRTAGDEASERREEAEWPVGAFVSTIERSLLNGDIDFAVHSYKDLPTTPTAGLVIAAVPERGIPNDILVTNRAVDLGALPPGLRIGTGSPRRSAQLRRLADVQVVPIRGNVPTRLARVQSGELDGVVVAAAGLERLGLTVYFGVVLPIDRFPPAPGQGALAVQAREGHGAADCLRALDHEPTRLAVDAERAFLREVGAGCRSPAAAYATVNEGRITLHAQLFSDDGARMVETTQTGADPSPLGSSGAQALLHRMRAEA